MPAILAEVSFVSSPADEAKLKSSSYRDKIAEGLFKGIAQYAVHLAQRECCQRRRQAFGIVTRKPRP